MAHEGDGTRESRVDPTREAAAIDARPPGVDAAALREHVDEAIRCIEAVEASVPPAYRVSVLESLLALSRGASDSGVGSPVIASAAESREQEKMSPPQDEMLIDLERYAHALAGPGRLLAKALITLEIVATQMGVDWMTPAEIERFLVDRARATHVYRTNVSNALRGARGLVDRRRRGRAYEYRITEAGRVVVDREVAILGPGPRD